MALELRNRWWNRGDVWWDWEAFVDDHGSGELNEVRSVDYVLHPTFARPVREVTDPEGGFVMRAGGLGGFELTAFARMKDGSTSKLSHKLQVRYEPESGVSISDEEQTRILQQLLARAGSYDGPVDGTYGARTTEAVKAFQRRHDLRIDGFAGPATWLALDHVPPGLPEEARAVRRAARWRVRRRDGSRRHAAPAPAGSDGRRDRRSADLGGFGREADAHAREALSVGLPASARRASA